MTASAPTPTVVPEPSQILRVLVTANPLFGHVNAVLPLAQAATRAGHKVVLATGPDMVAHVRRHGVQAVPVGLTSKELRAAHGDRWLELFAAAAHHRARALVRWSRAWPADIVIHEETELAGAVAATAIGAQHVVHGLGPVPPMRIWEALEPALATTGAQWGVPDVAGQLADALYLDLCPPALQPSYQSLWWRRLRLRPTALAATSSEQLPPSILRLPRHRTAYVTLGTVFNEASPVLDRAIGALRGLDVNVVATSGPGTDPRRFGPQPAHVVIEPYISQALLLPVCSLVVSQGGSGVMFGALSRGLPQLILPQGADQFANAKACVRAGVAIALSAEEASERAISDASRTLLEDPRHSAAAAVVGAQIEDMPDADEVLATIVHGATRPSPGRPWTSVRPHPGRGGHHDQS